MRVLWFSVTPSRYGANNTLHNGGGWIASLESLVASDPNIELAVSFEHPKDTKKSISNGVTYYPINIPSSSLDNLLIQSSFEKNEKLILESADRIIKDFQPDVIQVFGTEWTFGLVSQITNVPVVIHLQGSIPPYNNAQYPPGFAFINGVFWNGFKIRKTFREIIAHKKNALRENREFKIFQSCHNFMGRTSWDKSLTDLLSPKAKYFHCDEVLRDPFYQQTGKWVRRDAREFRLISVISGGMLKGHDLILKSANILKNYTSIPFTWDIFGTSDLTRAEKLTRITSCSVNVRAKGTLQQTELCNEMLNSDCFVHPSYIDNSPNSVCEAQLLGLPVVATSVGGIPSLVESGKTGLLVAANDPFHLAESIARLHRSPELSSTFSKNALSVAMQRHNKEAILKQLISIYTEITLAKRDLPK